LVCKRLIGFLPLDRLSINHPGAALCIRIHFIATTGLLITPGKHWTVYNPCTHHAFFTKNSMVILFYKVELKTNHLSGLEDGQMPYGRVLKNYLSWHNGIHRYHS
jgi:hypothetical protein